MIRRSYLPQWSHESEITPTAAPVVTGGLRCLWQFQTMTRSILAALLSLCVLAGVARAETVPDLVLARPGDPSPVILPLPAGVTIVECGGEAILNFYCLRTQVAREAAVLSQFSDGILRQGWEVLGEDSENRPFTSIFQRPVQGNECPLLIMFTSDTKAQPMRPPLAPGEVEIQLAKTADIRCIFN
jgi:hypothetical protein